MTLTELRYILALSEEKHFGRAAQKCFVSQPTLSVAIKKLEEELGVAIFERSKGKNKGKVVETELGLRLLAQARQILDQVNVFKDIVQDGKEGIGALVKVGAIYTIGPYLFPHIMPGLRKLAPDMSVYLEENYTSVLREKLLSCELDAIVVALPFDEPDVVTQALYDDSFVVLLPKGHALAEHDEISGEMLLQDNVLMLGPGHCFRDQVLSACTELMNIVNKPSRMRSEQMLVTEGSSLETIRHMVASGLGISVLPQSALMEGYYDSTLLDIRPFVQPQPYRTVGLAWRASFPQPELMDTLITGIKSVQSSITSTHLIQDKLTQDELNQEKNSAKGIFDGSA